MSTIPCQRILFIRAPRCGKHVREYKEGITKAHETSEPSDFILDSFGTTQCMNLRENAAAFLTRPLLGGQIMEMAPIQWCSDADPKSKIALQEITGQAIQGLPFPECLANIQSTKPCIYPIIVLASSTTIAKYLKISMLAPVVGSGTVADFTMKGELLKIHCMGDHSIFGPFAPVVAPPYFWHNTL